VFNLQGNNYRLIVIIEYELQIPAVKPNEILEHLMETNRVVPEDIAIQLEGIAFNF
jgi:mRNA-degrading endonuclease HigB of HigAB toxin-antitoxin module